MGIFSQSSERYFNYGLSRSGSGSCKEVKIPTLFRKIRERKVGHPAAGHFDKKRASEPAEHSVLGFQRE